MSASVDLMASFLHLAWVAGKRQRPLVRCRMLLLAADEALQLGLTDIADYCRLQVIALNPAHIVGMHATFAEARRTDDLQALLRQLRRRYPRERAEQLMSQLGLLTGQERKTYASDEEYASSLLGLSLDELHRAVEQARANWRADSQG